MAMSHEIRAIFEKGVLRPLEPLDIPDGARVHLHVEEDHLNSQSLVQATPAELQRQQDALQAMLREVDGLPQTPRNDGISGRDHDRILYGLRK